MSDAKPTRKVRAFPRVTKELLALLENPTVRSMQLADMNPAPYNPRTIDEDAADGLMESVLTFGVAELIVVNARTTPATIVGGHQRYATLTKAGARKTKVVVMDLSPSEERALNVALNSRHLQGTFTDALRELLDEIKIDMPDLSESLHFDRLIGDLDESLAGLADIGGNVGASAAGDGARPTPPTSTPGAAAGATGAPPTTPDREPQVDEAEVLRAKWGTAAGQLWTIPSVTCPGKVHRLLCGDTFVRADMDRLLAGDVVNMIASDPPYAIYGSSTGIGSDIADDKMVRPFFEALFKLAHERLGVFGHAYFACDWRSWAAIWESAKREQMTAKNLLVWDKGGQGLGSSYANAYELIGFFAKLPRQLAMKGGAETGQRQVHRPNILRFPRVAGAERMHNAAKPVPLYEELIINSSEVGDLVLEPFSGSGTTMLAAENQGRVCRAMEIEPRYIAVALERAERLGLKPVLGA